MTKRDIGKEIIAGLEEIKAWKRGEKKLRVMTVDLPRASDVATIRKQLGLSQEQFASFMTRARSRRRACRWSSAW